ncbi:MAG TPA: helix-turn-helix domain-containing protein [Pseudonocardia sp.]|nr:helix-turn-helix domain-containing protein [Pseudonocardia sp.]
MVRAVMGGGTVDRRTDTREAIRSVALEQFGERGYERTSLRELAERLRITKAAVYHHFATKEDILASLAGEFTAPVDELLAWGNAQRPGPDTRRELLRRYAELLAGRHGRLVRFLDSDRAGLRDMPAVLEVYRRLDGLCTLLTSGGPTFAPGRPADPAAALRARLSLSALHSGSASGSAAGADPRGSAAAGQVSADELRDAALAVACELVDR